jgi:8-oxo-dGTP diphosphatase
VKERPRVGVGVLVMRDGNVLLGRRLGAHGEGSWAPPGGNLEYGESVEACARREVREETGLDLDGLSRGPYTEDLFEPEGKHYVTLFVVARALAGEPTVREPARCATWQWFRWTELPTPLFLPLESLHRRGFVPDDAA